MIFSNADIKKAIEQGKVIIEPLPEDIQYNSSALDLRLGNEFKEYDEKLLKQKGTQVVVDYSHFYPAKFLQAYLKDIPLETDGSLIVKPGDFILAKTLEKIHLPIEHQIAARVEGRSSAARLGLVIHLACPTIHAGFKGNITLEIINQGPAYIRLDPGKDRICQLVFEQVLSKPENGVLSQFQNQTSVTGNKSNQK
ncbi:MAG: dCTP deaminase [Deltaproteobacteria bacterium]|nr:dCTP deaminase [Deltaproteobacteria bacterium]